MSSTAPPAPTTEAVERGHQRTAPPEYPAGAVKRAVCYVRVSTPGQTKTWTDDEGLSLNAQEDVCRRHAATLNAEVIDVYKEKGISGRKRETRPALNQMLEDLKEHSVDYVIVYRLDRLARNTVDDVQLAEEIAAAGAQLVSTQEHFDESTPAGWLMHRIQAVFAEYEVKQGSHRVSMAMARKAELGGTPTKPPIGYLNHRDPSEGGGRGLARIIIDDERAPLVRWAFEAYASHEWSIQRLVDELDERGLRSRPHKRHALPRPLKKNDVHRMLRGRYCVGKVSWKGEEFDGNHEPLIDTELFERVQELLSSRNQSGGHYRVHDHYLKGTLYCGECGGRFYYDQVTNRHGKKYQCFVCRGRQLRKCAMRHLRIDDVEAKVEDLYIGLSLPRNQIEEVLTRLRSDIDRLEVERAEIIATQEARLQRLVSEETKNAHAYHADAISLEVLKVERDRIAKERADAQRVIAKADVRYEAVEPVIHQAMELASNLEGAYLSASPNMRRTINQVIFERINIYRDDERAELTEAFAGLYETAGHRHPNIQSTDAPSHGHHKAKSPGTDSPSQGSRPHVLVGAEGLEPPTPSL